MRDHIVIETELSPKKLCRKLDRDLVEYRPTLNIFSLGRFMRKHRYETFFYGCRRDDSRVMIFHHTAKKRDGGARGFFGEIEKTENGSRLVGKIRKPVSAYIAAAAITLICVFLMLMSAGLREFIAFGVFAGILTVSLFMILFDDKKKYIEAYLDTIRKENTRKEEN
ncbi:MAG: hypothetical protein IJ571_05515 [Ruminococcus sp.]|nr:hypothetical protein [Ruminococcus sp.]